MADEGEDMVEHLTKKYGPGMAAGANDPNSSLHIMGRAVGIEFVTNRRIVPTQRAHALVEHLKATRSNEVANQFVEELYRTYFEEGNDINQVSLLTALVQRYGVNADEATGIVTDPKHLQNVVVQEGQVKTRYRVSGVPFYMIHPNNGDDPPVAFSGVYPVDVIAEHLKEAADS